MSTKWSEIDEQDELVDVSDKLDEFTRMWAEKVGSFEQLRRRAALWAHELGQREAEARATK